MHDEKSNRIVPLKLLVIGDSQSGKSTLIEKYCSGNFIEDIPPTIGLNFQTKQLVLDDNSECKLLIWDTSGQQKHQNISTTYYKNSIGCIIVFSVTDKTSFENLPRWIEQLKEHAVNDIIFDVIGNKSDLELRRQVSYDEASELCRSYDCNYTETSCISDNGLDDAFRKISKKMQRMIQSKDDTSITNGTLSYTTGRDKLIISPSRRYETMNTIPEENQSIFFKYMDPCKNQCNIM